jgi:hypothetical protein
VLLDNELHSQDSLKILMTELEDLLATSKSVESLDVHGCGLFVTGERVLEFSSSSRE